MGRISLFAGCVFAGLFGLALAAFWPSYLSRLPAGGISGYAHVHAIVMALWFALLIAQAFLIRADRRALHRRLGALSYGLAPAVVVTGVLLAHAALVRDAAADPAGAGATLYLPLAMLAWFIACYGLAIVYRKAPALHARFMIGSCLAAVDPIAARLAAFYLPPFDHPARYELVSGGVAAAILGLAIAIDCRAIGAAPPAIRADRGTRRGRAVFPVMLAAIAGLFALWFWFAPSSTWLAFARWFHGLPLT